MATAQEQNRAAHFFHRNRAQYAESLRRIKRARKGLVHAEDCTFWAQGYIWECDCK